MSKHLRAEVKRLQSEIEAIRQTGSVAPAMVRVVPYLAFNGAKKPYQYYKLVAPETIFEGQAGGKTKTVHLGTAANKRYQHTMLSIQRRDAIAKIEAQIVRVEELMQKNAELPSAGTFHE
jgi:hypothetical protein